MEKLTLVSRTRCGILHAAPQSRDRTKHRLFVTAPDAAHRFASATRCAASGARNLATNSIGRKTVEQAVATGALKIVLRAAAVGAARGMRGVPGFRGVVIAQPKAVRMAEHGGALRAARPV